MPYARIRWLVGATTKHLSARSFLAEQRNSSSFVLMPKVFRHPFTRDLLLPTQPHHTPPPGSPLQAIRPQAPPHHGRRAERGPPPRTRPTQRPHRPAHTRTPPCRAGNSGAAERYGAAGAPTSPLSWGGRGGGGRRSAAASRGRGRSHPWPLRGGRQVREQPRWACREGRNRAG